MVIFFHVYRECVRLFEPTALVQLELFSVWLALVLIVWLYRTCKRKTRSAKIVHFKVHFSKSVSPSGRMKFRLEVILMKRGQGAQNDAAG